MSHSPSRAGIALPGVLALLVVLGFVLARLSTLTQGQAFLAHAHQVDAEHLYRAEAVLAQVSHRLGTRSWMRRWYAQGGLGTGPYETREVGEYRGGKYVAWVRDVQLPTVAAVPGLVDVMIRVGLEGIERSFHYRLSVLPGSSRRRQRVRIEAFTRLAGDIEDEAVRRAAAEEATWRMREAADQAAMTELMLSDLPGSLQDGLTGGKRRAGVLPDPAELVEKLLAGGEKAELERLKSGRIALRRGIHLMGASGIGLQDFLDPLERGRFVYREGNFPASRNALQEAIRLLGRFVRPQAVAVISLARTYAAEAWRIGPASRVGQILLGRGFETLAAFLERLEKMNPDDAAKLGPTLHASILLDQARIAILMNDRPGKVDELLERASALTQGGRIFGGTEEPDRVIAASVEDLATAEAKARIQSRTPLGGSGMKRVGEKEVDGVLVDPESGWEDWPADTGKDPDWWEDEWKKGDRASDGDRDGLGDGDGEGAGGDGAGAEGGSAEAGAGGDAADAVASAQESAAAADKAADAAQAKADAKSQEANQLRSMGLLEQAEQAAREAVELAKVADEAKEAATEAAAAADKAAEAAAAGDTMLAQLAASAAAGATLKAAEAAQAAGASKEAAQAARSAADTAKEAAAVKDTQDLAVSAAQAQADRNAARQAAEMAMAAEAVADAYSAAAKAAAAGDAAGALGSIADAEALQIPDDAAKEALAVEAAYQRAADLAAEGKQAEAWAAYGEANAAKAALSAPAQTFFPAGEPAPSSGTTAPSASGSPGPAGEAPPPPAGDSPPPPPPPPAADSSPPSGGGDSGGGSAPPSGGSEGG